MRELRKPLSILLVLILALSVFTIVPVTTAGATGESGSGESGSGESGSGESGVEGTEPEIGVITNHEIRPLSSFHATVTPDKTWAHKDQTVNLTLTVDPGYRFIRWAAYTNSTGDTEVDLVIENNSFVMPDYDVFIQALTEAIPTHNVTVTHGEHGTASANVQYTYEGDTVTLTATPDEGYALNGWEVVSGGVTIENNRFVMMTDDVEIHAVFAPCRYVANFTELRSALNDGSGVIICLKNDIQADGMTGVYSGKTAILDLNGHTLSRTNGGIIVGVDGNLTLRDTKGGGKITGGTESGINVVGTLTFESGEISGNSSGNGGGIYVKNGTLNMKGGFVCNNTASDLGGGIYLKNSRMTMSGGTVSANSCSNRGGGILLIDNSNATMTGGAVTGNTAVYSGGVSLWSGCSFMLKGGEISNNTASTTGGGVYPREGSTFSMEGGSVTGNRAPEAPAVMADGTCNLSGGSITGNVGTDTRYRGAVRVILTGASLRLSGSPIIKDNLVGGGQSNVFLQSAKNLTITGELADTACIGVEKEIDGVFTSGLNGKGTLDNFTSDNANKAILLNNSGEAYFVNKVHTVTVTTNNGYGKASASVSSAEAGTVVTLTATPDEDFYLRGWVVVSGGVTIENDQFVMPYEAVEIRAIFEEITYPVTVTVENPEGGTASASIDSAPKYKKVYLDATPTEGYCLKEWKVVSGSVTIEKYNVSDDDNQTEVERDGFVMPGEPVEIKAIFEKTPHAVSFNYDENKGTVTANKNEAAKGDIVTVTVTPSEGYRFLDYWGTVALISTDTPGVYEFEMPDQDVDFGFWFEPLYAINTDDNVDVYRWVGLNAEDVTSAGKGDVVYIELKDNAVPDEGKYFTGEYLVNGVSLGKDGDDPWSGYNYSFEMPEEAVTITAVQADKEALTLDLRSGDPVELSYDAFILLVTEDVIPRIYPDDSDDILFDLDNSGVPDVRVYYIEEKDENDVVTAITYYAVKAENADAAGRNTFAYTGSTVRYSTISFILPGSNICGDADGDGIVTILDATAIQRKLAGFADKNYTAQAADADGDGKVTIVDATAIQRHLVGLSANPNIGKPIA